MTPCSAMCWSCSPMGWPSSRMWGCGCSSPHRRPGAAVKWWSGPGMTTAGVTWRPTWRKRHPSGSGLTARCPTSPGSLWFPALCPMPAWCHRRGHCCAPRVILGSKSSSPLGPLRSLVESPCRWCAWLAESCRPSWENQRLQ
uniref:Alternative protein PIDD n=1 Tax=Homo sapiens TaxID=9606 RepID=L8E8G9_HUMAN|nr:alternative protein PIDD [Homo sapiens]